MISRLLLIATAAGCIATAYSDHGTGHSNESADPVVTDSSISSTNSTSAQIDNTTSTNTKATIIDWLIQTSVILESQAEAQALYVAGHKNYQLGRLDHSAQAFADLTALAPNTFLEIEALRMLAQIKMATSQPIDDVLLEYQAAINVLNDIEEDADPIAVETAVISFGMTFALLSQSVGDCDAAISMCDRILGLTLVGDQTKVDALKIAGTSAFANRDMELTREYFNTYLDNYPEFGWDDGNRIEALRYIAMCDGDAMERHNRN